MARSTFIAAAAAIFVADTLVSSLTMAVPARAESPTVPDFSGDYRMQGKGLGTNDSAYDGTCSVRQAGATYRVSCFNRDTRHTYVGKGLAIGETLAIFIGDVLRGDHNSVFAGEYLVVYRRRADGVLEGTWIHAPTDAAGTETLTPAN